MNVLTAAILDSMIAMAKTTPIETDISDYSNEWCAGFLRGQWNALIELRNALAEAS